MPAWELVNLKVHYIFANPVSRHTVNGHGAASKLELPLNNNDNWTQFA